MPSAVPSEDITLIHVIRPEKAESWVSQFLEEWKLTGKPPLRWFRFGFRSGVYIVPVPRIEDLSKLTKEELLSKAWYIFRSTPEIFKRSLEETIVIAMNPKRESIWMSGLGRNDRTAQKLKRNWYLNPRNWFRRNEFSPEFISNLRRDFRIVFRHSGLYDDYKVIGHVKDPIGDFNMYSGLLTNGKMIDSSKVFVPEIYLDSPGALEIYSPPQSLEAAADSCIALFK